MKIQKIVNEWFYEFLFAFAAGMICIIALPPNLRLVAGASVAQAAPAVVGFAVAYTTLVMVMDYLRPMRQATWAVCWNLFHYPSLFMNARNHIYQELPQEVQDEIARISARPMTPEDAKHMAAILDDFVCDACGKLQCDCTCEDGPADVIPAAV